MKGEASTPPGICEFAFIHCSCHSVEADEYENVHVHEHGGDYVNVFVFVPVFVAVFLNVNVNLGRHRISGQLRLIFRSPQRRLVAVVQIHLHRRCRLP